MGPLRPIDGPDARHTVLEAVSPEAGHVVIHYLHLAAAKSRALKQVKLVIRTVLGARSQHEPATPMPRTRSGRLQVGKESRHHKITPTPSPCLKEGIHKGAPLPNPLQEEWGLGRFLQSWPP